MADIDILVNDARVRYTATAGQTIFPYDFPVFDGDQIVVTRNRANVETVLVEVTDYAVTQVGDEDGGDVVLVVPALLDDVYLVERVTPIERVGDFQPTGEIPHDVLNKELDSIIMMLQELYRDQGRTLAFPTTAPDNISAFLPLPQAAYFLRWNATGTALENAQITGSGTIGIPVSIAEGGHGAITAAAGLANLGGLALAGGDMTGRLELAQGADLASGTTVNLGAATGNVVEVTGSSAIQSFGDAQNGTTVRVYFSGTPIIEHDALISNPIMLAGNANQQQVAGTLKPFTKFDGKWYEGAGGGSSGGGASLFEYFYNGN